LKTPLPAPGVHLNVPEQTYRQWDAPSQSVLKAGDTALDMRVAIDHPSPPTREQIVGAALHWAFFEPGRFAERCIDAPIVNKRKPSEREDLAKFYADNPGSHPRLGTTHSAESRAKISAAKRANPVRPWLGKARAEETKRKISAAQKGVKKAPRVYTEEGLAKARANMARHAQKPVPLEFAAVLEKFPAGVQARYDFSEAVYTGALSRITGIKCSVHGEFSQYSAQLRKGRGCPACGALIRGAKKKQDMLERWADPATREAMLEARK